ncbi:MAG TPA: type II secretion system protein [Candidatus Xenobia bacterium]|nr:type II secretion system protein [Candidatus Xenobia bacterium]
MRTIQRHRDRGFTLIELMIVLTIIATLISIAIPNYRYSLRRAKETVLRQNLFTLRQAIDQYTLDKQSAPQSLEDLSGAGYLREVPKDITGETSTWQLDFCEESFSPEQTSTGLCDVHSGSSEISTEGTPYNTW